MITAARAGFGAVVMLALLAPAPVVAEAAKPDPRDVAAVQNCLKTRGRTFAGEPCIGIIADPCLKRPASKSTADMVACADREQAVWDDLLNSLLRQLREQYDAEQREKLTEVQRVWMESRDRTCGFYAFVYRGNLAAPAFCTFRETARRAMFLRPFLDEIGSRR